MNEINKCTANANMPSATIIMPISNNTTTFADKLENIMLKMIYRMLKEEDHVTDNVGHVA